MHEWEEKATLVDESLHGTCYFALGTLDPA